MVGRHIIQMTVAYVILAAIYGCQNDNVFDAKVYHSKEWHTYSVEVEKVSMKDAGLVGISGIHVCGSAILLKTSHSSQHSQIHILSLPGLFDMGHYLTRGRGTNELLSPIIKSHAKDSGGDDLVYIFDLNLCSSYCLNLSESVRKQSTALTHLINLPSGTVDAYPYGEKHVVIVPESNDYVCSIIDESGQQVNRMSLYPDLPGIWYFDTLSSANAVDRDKEKLVMAMCMIPQVNILNLDTGEKKTAAVAEDYRDWRKILDKDARQRIYYTGITQSSEYVMALYCDARFEDWVKEQYMPHIHIFDWDGNFLYDITLDKKLKAIAYDESGDCMYGIDINDEIYRYVFQGI